MTRNGSIAMTEEMRQQFDVWREREQAYLAELVLDLVGADDDYVYEDALLLYNDELTELLGHVRACFSSEERRPLYRNNDHLGVAVAKLVLRAAGHPLDPLPGGRLTLARDD